MGIRISRVRFHLNKESKTLLYNLCLSLNETDSPISQIQLMLFKGKNHNDSRKKRKRNLPTNKLLVH